MKKVSANLFAMPIKVRVNTTNKSKNQWAEIVNARSGEVLHRGQLKHIRYVAKKRYNVNAAL
jgi:hypothetical protein